MAGPAPGEHAVHSGRRWAKTCGVAVASLSAAAALSFEINMRWAGAWDKARFGSGALLLGRQQAAAQRGVALSARAHRDIVDRVHGKLRRHDSVAGVSIDKVALEARHTPALTRMQIRAWLPRVCWRTDAVLLHGVAA